MNVLKSLRPSNPCDESHNNPPEFSTRNGRLSFLLLYYFFLFCFFIVIALLLMREVTSHVIELTNESIEKP